MKRIAGILTAAALALSAGATATLAQSDYPSRTVTVLVGFAAGGATDILARALADGLQQELGATFVVENRAGASGAIAAQQLAQSEPDGYTLMVTAGAAMTINVHMPPKPLYNSLKDFTFITQLAANDGVLAISNSLPTTTFEEFLAYAKENGDRLSYGVSGVGSPTHLGTELLKETLGIEMVNVPYPGDARVAVDLIANVLPVGVLALPSVVGQIKDGQFRAIAMLGTTDYEDFPDVPNIATLGHPDMTVQTWLGLIGPAGMPDELVERLYQASAKVMADEKMIAHMKTQNSNIVASSPADFTRHVTEEYAKWGGVVTSLGLDKQQ